jgi:multidrug resistance efflux pump
MTMRFASLVLCLAAGGCARESTLEKMTVQVKKADLVFAGSFYGEIEARESHPILVPEFHNTWQVTVASVLDDGTRVKKGDVVLTFSKGTFEEDLRDNEADLAVSEASLRKVKEQNEDEAISRSLAVQRSQMLVELAKLNVVEGVNLVSKLDLEKAKVDLSRAELQLELDRKELVVFGRKRAAALDIEKLKVQAASEKVKEIRSQLELMEVKAPSDGILYAPYTRLNWMRTKAAPGKVARPGDKILEIPELDRFNAAVYVRQRDASLVRVGDEAAVVATMFPDRVFKGKVVSKDEFSTTRNERSAGNDTPQGNLKEVKVVLELEDTTEPLRPGGTVRADLQAVLAQGVPLAPLAALKEVPGGGYTAVLKGGRVVQVKVGKTSTTYAEVLEGLSPGDELVME